MIVEGIRLSNVIQIISAVQPSKLLNQGCKAFLSNFINSTSEYLKLNEIWVVCEFADVFPKELHELPPDSEVEFAIEVYFGTTLMFIAPYHMASVELKLLEKNKVW